VLHSGYEIANVIEINASAVYSGEGFVVESMYNKLKAKISSSVPEKTWCIFLVGSVKFSK
jgi:hypothetical protein